MPDVSVRAPDGQIGFVPKADLDKALAAGAQVVGPEEVQSAKLQEQYGGVKGHALSAATGLASGLTFGGSDYLYKKAGESLGIGKEVSDVLRETKEANPYTHGAAEIVGAVAPAIATGGESLAARGIEGVGLIPRTVYGAGRVAENAVGNLVGRGAEGVIARTGQSVARHAAGAAVEGAAFGAGQELSDAAINDHELTAEKILASAGKTALLGGVLGAGTGAISELGSSALSGIASRVTKNQSVADWLEKQSGAAAFRAARPGQAIAKSAEKFSDEGFEGVGRLWRNEAPGMVGKKSFSSMTGEDLKEAAGIGLKQYGEKIGSVLDHVDSKVSTEALPRAADIANEAAAIASKLEQHAGAGAAVNKIRSFENDVRRITGLVDETGAPVAGGENLHVTYKQLQQLRRDADDIAFGAKLNPDLMKYKGAFSDLRNRYETILKDGIQANTDAETLREYESAKKGYQAFNWLQKATEKERGAEGGNLGITLTEKLAGHTGGVIGAVLGGPIGFAAGEAIGVTGAKLARKHGEFLTADILQRLGKLSAVEAASNRIDSRIAEGVDGFFRGARAEASARSIRRPTAEHYLEQAERITQLAQNPDAMMSHIDRSIGNLGPQSPRLSAALAQKAANDISFLASKAPVAMKNINSLTPQFEKPRFSEEKVSAFAKYLHGVKDPMSLIDDLNRGVVSREKVEAVRATSPKLYDLIRERIIERSNDLHHKLSYDKKLQLGILFQAPTDETLTPDFIRAMQQTATAQTPSASEPKKPQKQGGSRRPIDLHSTDYSIGHQAKGD